MKTAHMHKYLILSVFFAVLGQPFAAAGSRTTAHRVSTQIPASKFTKASVTSEASTPVISPKLGKSHESGSSGLLPLGNGTEFSKDLRSRKVGDATRKRSASVGTEDKEAEMASKVVREQAWRNAMAKLEAKVREGGGKKRTKGRGIDKKRRAKSRRARAPSTTEKSEEADRTRIEPNTDARRLDRSGTKQVEAMSRRDRDTISRSSEKAGAAERRREKKEKKKKRGAPLSIPPSSSTTSATAPALTSLASSPKSATSTTSTMSSNFSPEMQTRDDLPSALRLAGPFIEATATKSLQRVDSEPNATPPTITTTITTTITPRTTTTHSDSSSEQSDPQTSTTESEKSSCSSSEYEWLAGGQWIVKVKDQWSSLCPFENGLVIRLENDVPKKLRKTLRLGAALAILAADPDYFLSERVLLLVNTNHPPSSHPTSSHPTSSQISNAARTAESVSQSGTSAGMSAGSSSLMIVSSDLKTEMWRENTPIVFGKGSATDFVILRAWDGFGRVIHYVSGGYEGISEEAFGSLWVIAEEKLRTQLLPDLSVKFSIVETIENARLCAHIGCSTDLFLPVPLQSERVDDPVKNHAFLLDVAAEAMRFQTLSLEPEDRTYAHTHSHSHTHIQHKCTTRKSITLVFESFFVFFVWFEWFSYGSMHKLHSINVDFEFNFRVRVLDRKLQQRL